MDISTENGPTPVSCRIIEAVAEREGVDPTDLETPLYDVIDPEALDALFESGGVEGSSATEVSLTYYGYLITVSSRGIRVVPAERGTVSRGGTDAVAAKQ